MAAFTSSTSQLHSLSKLHSCPLPFLLRSSSSSFPRKSLLLFAPITLIPNPQPAEDSPWIGKWNQKRFPNLPKKVRAVVDYRGSFVSDEDDEEDAVGASRSTGSSTMEKIVEKLKKFGYVDDLEERKERSLPEKGSVEDIFYTEDGVLPNSRGGLGAEEEVRFPWEKAEGGGGDGKRRKESKSSVAELTLPEGELRRLRHSAIRTKSKTKIGGSGVTKEIVDKIHEKWQTEEVVRLKCEGPPALNMRRMHEILERKTGGLVIWRSGSSISLYRGVSYDIPQPVKHQSSYFNMNRTIYKPAGSPVQNYRSDKKNAETLHNGDGDASNVDENSDTASSPPEIKYEHEMDSLLDSLGPRCTDWTGCDPLPVDADLLPGFVPGYKPPFRILPYGVRRSLGMKDQTALRRLARSLPPHFALRQSRQHQGLATAMVKLWENSSIAKIALKRGVQLTTSERMAEDIKKLTGGVLLCRNKDYIVFYRGKDFLAPELTEALLERERLAKDLQDKEEQARARASSLIFDNTPVEEYGGTGTLTETQEANARWGKQLNDNDKNKMLKAADVKRHANLVRKLERKFFIAKKKLAKAEKALGKVEEFLKPAENKNDPESISDEERFMFRKLGLKMKAFLLLGRRGVFDGTVENMHLHWKYRELVKIIAKAKTFAQVRNVALSLEAESGGILVSVDKVSKGFAIIVYRGRDYHRPRSLRPKNLLTKRKALARSIELQRQAALNLHVSNMHVRVEKLKSELAQMEVVKEHGNEELYCKLDSTYLSDDEDTEDEGDDDAYLETVESTINDGNEGEDNEEDYEENSDGSVHLAVSSYNQRISLLSSNSESSMLDNSFKTQQEEQYLGFRE